MTTNKTTQRPPEQANVTLPAQVIYADRIINVGIGASVSRLTLAMEVGENTFGQFAQLVIPTPALFEVLEFMATTITSNDEVKRRIVDGLETFKAKIAKAHD